jgi:hypothetical protein
MSSMGVKIARKWGRLAALQKIVDATISLCVQIFYNA